jgi:hypothetical protein
MIAYHPALDPYHTIVRLARLLNRTQKAIQWEALCIMDFYLVFPEDLHDFRCPQGTVGWRNEVARPPNRYWFSGDRMLIFQRMRLIQRTAVSAMVGSGLVSRDKLQQREVELISAPQGWDDLILRSKEETDARVLDFIVSVLAPLPLRGLNGLKDRSKLLEHRYDV